MTTPAGLTEVSSLPLKTVLVKQQNASSCALWGFATQRMPEVLLYRMNKHKSHSSSLGFSTSWCVELCFELNTCHRCCQISWINAVAQIITSLVFRDEADSRWQSVWCGLCMLLCTHQCLERSCIFSSSAHQRRSRQDGLSVGMLPEGRLQELDPTEKASNNLYYGIVPSRSFKWWGGKPKARGDSMAKDLRVMNDECTVKFSLCLMGFWTDLWLSVYHIQKWLESVNRMQ